MQTHHINANLLADCCKKYEVRHDRLVIHQNPNNQHLHKSTIQNDSAGILIIGLSGSGIKPKTNNRAANVLTTRSLFDPMLNKPKIIKSIGHRVIISP